MTKPYIIEGVRPEQLGTLTAELSAIYAEFGVVIFPGLLRDDPDFVAYLDSIRFLFQKILARHGLVGGVGSADDLGDLLVQLDKVCAMDGKIITDMGTQPNKLFHLNRIKYSGMVQQLLGSIWPSDAVVATPQAGDTLHLFAPGERYLPYNLPMHQDYPYLMQSPQQVTFYLGMSDFRDGCGGLQFWESSHKAGVLASTKNRHGAYEVADVDAVAGRYPEVSYHWNAGDFAFFDSLLCHRSIANGARDAGRVVQIFRFSNLNHPVAGQFNWYSTSYGRRGVHFDAAFPELFVPPAE